jgi:hypothetical protein
MVVQTVCFASVADHTARVAINKRALVARIRREFERLGDGRDLRVSRAGSRKQLGEYYVVQEGRREIVEGHVSLEELGRRLGIVETWEYLEKI